MNIAKYGNVSVKILPVLVVVLRHGRGVCSLCATDQSHEVTKDIGILPTGSSSIQFIDGGQDHIPFRKCPCTAIF